MKHILSCNHESSTDEALLSELITEITSLKIKLPEDQVMLTEAQVFFNGGVESAIQKIRKARSAIMNKNEINIISEKGTALTNIK
jgi:hypothetical protein